VSGRASIALDDETRTILAGMSIDGTVAKLPPGQLARPVYEKVNKALTALGGKWNRHKGGHVFVSDPTALLRGGVQAGAVENLKTKYQFFETPEPLAAEMVRRVNVSAGDKVLEPSAGSGRLVRPCLDAGAQVWAIEIWDANIPFLHDLLPATNVLRADFLTLPEHSAPFDIVMMNPPFTGKQAIRHIQQAWGWLREGGSLVAICDHGALVNQSKEERAFQGWLREIGAEVEDLPSGTFSESGTEVSACLITATNGDA